MSQQNNKSLSIFDRIKDFIAPEDDDYRDGEFTDTDIFTAVQPAEKSVPSYKTDMKINIYEPAVFEEAEAIAAALKQNTACLLNLHRMSAAYAQRLIDFLTGVVYGLDGNIQKVGHQMILCTPASVSTGGTISRANVTE